MKPEPEDIFGLYRRCVAGVVEYLQKQMRLKVRRSVYTTQVVIWLMIVQRLQARRTLAGGVEALLSGIADPLLSGCERAREKRISRRTGRLQPRAAAAAQATMRAGGSHPANRRQSRKSSRRRHRA